LTTTGTAHRDPHKLVAETRSRCLAAVEEFATARAELVDLRATELWAMRYPDEAAGRAPKTELLALGVRANYAGLADRAREADGVLDLLRADVEAVASAMTNAQRVLVEQRRAPGCEEQPVHRSPVAPPRLGCPEQRDPRSRVNTRAQRGERPMHEPTLNAGLEHQPCG